MVLLKDEVVGLLKRAAELADEGPGEVAGLTDGVSTVLAALLLGGELRVEPAAQAGRIRVEGWGSVKSNRPAPPLEAIKDVDSLWQALEQSTGHLTLKTSGTSGAAKSIRHDFHSLSAAVRRGPAYQDHVWALTYPVVSFAGLQVLFQALANGNPLVPVHGLPWLQVAETLAQHRVTHISATPTFLRTLATVPRAIFPDVQRVVVGGERWDAAERLRLATMFPNAQFRNIYASTELGSLLQSEGDIFQVPNDQQDRIKVVEGELWVRPFAASTELLDDEGFFHTGDQVQVLGTDPWRFRFLGRSSNVINVAGHKVDPEQVEAVLEQMPQVQAALVYGKDNPVTGKLIVADIVLRSVKNGGESAAEGIEPLPDSDPSVQNSQQVVTQIRAALANQLPRHQIPRILNVVPEIPLTASGKKRRTQA